MQNATVSESIGEVTPLKTFMKSSLSEKLPQRKYLFYMITKANLGHWVRNEIPVS